jgi:hypothetical protein
VSSLVPGGLLIFTTHGETEASVLSSSEAESLTNEGFVVRDRVPEGTKMYGTWFHSDYVQRRWINEMELIARWAPGEHRLIQSQEAWCVRKSASASMSHAMGTMDP